MRVFYQWSDREGSHERHPLDIFDVLPRIGERIHILDDRVDMEIPATILYITHESGQGEHNIILTLAYLSEEPLSFFVAWIDDSERPEWIDAELMVLCQTAPRVGELLRFDINTLDDAEKECVVEIASVVHSTLVDPEGLAGDQTVTILHVRRTDSDSAGHPHRAIARARQN